LFHAIPLPEGGIKSVRNGIEHLHEKVKKNGVKVKSKFLIPELGECPRYRHTKLKTTRKNMKYWKTHDTAYLF
jgi:hypothetical protein